jgi:transcriptional repressor NrdR
VHCLYCGSTSTRVVDSRLTDPGDAVRRRRECEACHERFTTYERAEAIPVTVRKRDGRRERFDRQKLLRGLVRAANKRPVSDEQLERLADEIAARVRRLGPEAEAELIGELAMRGLVELDPVTALLFASVYRNFRDLAELEAELHRIRSEPIAGEGQLALAGGAAGPPIPSDPRATLDDPPTDATRGSIASEIGKGQ